MFMSEYITSFINVHLYSSNDGHINIAWQSAVHAKGIGNVEIQYTMLHINKELCLHVICETFISQMAVFQR